MTFKIATQKEFINTWFRSFTDPDGNDMPTMILGGKEDSYTKYVLRKQVEYNANNTTGNERSEKFTHKIQTKSIQTEPSDEQYDDSEDSEQSEDTKYYVWRGGGCEACAALDGEIFEEGSEPSSLHPNCGCTLEEVNEDGSKVKDGDTKDPSPWTEDSKSSKEILEERGVDYDKKVEGVRDRRALELQEKKKKVVSSYYGQKEGVHPNGHTGTDFRAKIGTPIKAPVSGTVIRNDTTSGNGNRIAIRDKDGLEHHFYHMNEPSQLPEGVSISKGDNLGFSGNTGRSTGPHVHYEVRNPSLGSTLGEQTMPPREDDLNYLVDYFYDQ